MCRPGIKSTSTREIEERDGQYLLEQQHKYENLDENYRRDANEHYCEFCRQLLLASTVLLGLSGTIATASSLFDRPQGLSLALLLAAWLGLLLSIGAGIAYLWKSAMHLRSYVDFFQTLAKKAHDACCLREFNAAYERASERMKLEAGREWLVIELWSFLGGALLLTTSFIAVLMQR